MQQPSRRTTIKDFLFAISACALFLSIARINRFASLVSIPLFAATVCVTIAVAFGIRHRLIVAAIGGLSGLMGLLAVDFVTPFTSGKGGDVFLTHEQYIRLVQTEIVHLSVLVPLAFASGGTIGYLFSRVWGGRNDRFARESN
ncbi:MAG: hypothetical protein KDB03_16235 [Planctomycetales bacterium]|nr:hypothetical protein [Planctomycetales bacterium]